MDDKLKLLIIIVDRQKVDKVAEMVSKNGASFSHISLGKGTAKNDLLNVFGLGETEKGILLCSTKHSNIENIFSGLKFDFGFDKPGGGIAFTIPISSVGGPASLKIMQG